MLSTMRCVRNAVQGTFVRSCSSVTRKGKNVVPTVVNRGQHTSTNDISGKPLMSRPKVVDMKNGDKLSGLFSVQEMENRLATLRRFMDRNSIGAILFTSYHNINYYSDFVFCAFGRPYGLLVTNDKSITITNGIDGGHPWRRCYGDNTTYTDWHRNSFLEALNEELDGVEGHLGVEFDHLSMDLYRKLDHAFPLTAKLDIGMQCMRMRMLKTPEEIEVIREGARIADIGGAKIVEALQEGVPEYLIARASTQAMVDEIAKSFPQTDIMDTWTWFQSGINTDGAHNPLTTKKVEKGEVLSLNCFPMIAGYYTALERTLFLDYVPDACLKLWELNCAVHERGLDLIKPGVRCCDIARELNEMYQHMGLLEYRSFGYGHSFGTLSHYYGREAALELREDIETELQPNMVISMEPMIMIPWNQAGAGGYREHDILLVTETGSENFTKFPYGPENLVIKK